MRIGTRQAALLRRCGPLRIITAFNYLDRRALRRLEARGIVRPAIGWPNSWKITEDGRVT